MRLKRIISIHFIAMSLYFLILHLGIWYVNRQVEAQYDRIKETLGLMNTVTENNKRIINSLNTMSDAILANSYRISVREALGPPVVDRDKEGIYTQKLLEEMDE